MVNNNGTGIASIVVTNRNRLLSDRNHGLSAVMRELRMSHGITSTQVGAAMGVGRTSVCNIESGRQVVSIEKLREFAEFLDLDVIVSFRPRNAGVTNGAEVMLEGYADA